ncbi:hypothetical protein GC194_04895 [bacterium]|nr:hypothetical protein [bacterium]
MALANFLKKAGLAAAQVVQDFKQDVFENVLENTKIGIAFSDNAYKTKEGKVCLELLINLSSRLYPKMVLQFPSEFHSYAEELVTLAKSINPDIEIQLNGASASIWMVAGKTNFITNDTCLFIGSSSWNASFSRFSAKSFCDTNNVFGAAAAACLASANLFKWVFKDYLNGKQLDDDIIFSMKNFELLEALPVEEMLPEVKLENFQLVGLGAIGNAFIWSIAKLEGLSGSISLVDHEDIDLSNLQRYILGVQRHLDNPTSKLSLATDALAHQTSLKILDNEPMELTEYTAKHRLTVELLAIGVDNVNDRIRAQATLPKYILNAWTQPGDLGISRHFDFINTPCLSCIYWPKGVRPHHSDIVAKSLGLEQMEKETKIVRQLLSTGDPVGIQIIEEIAKSKKIPMGKLAGFEALPMEKLYSKVACGGDFIEYFDQEDQKKLEVPLAFQSVFAGLMLASETIQYYTHFNDTKKMTTSRINIMDKLSDYTSFSHKAKKKSAAGCFCGDELFIEEYKTRWPE